MPAALLELVGVLQAADPPRHVIYQALVGILQCAIGVATPARYRQRRTVWAAW